MTLGEDMYFQRSAMFWKYNSIGFTKEGNPQIKQNLTDITFDSEITSQLRSHRIGITESIISLNKFSYHI